MSRRPSVNCVAASRMSIIWARENAKRLATSNQFVNGVEDFELHLADIPAEGAPGLAAEHGAAARADHHDHHRPEAPREDDQSRQVAQEHKGMLPRFMRPITRPQILPPILGHCFPKHLAEAIENVGVRRSVSLKRE